MRKLGCLILILLLLPITLLASGRHRRASPRLGRGGIRMGRTMGRGPAPRRAAPNKNVKLEGTVRELYTPKRRGTEQMDLETKSGTVAVLLAPAWFLGQQNWTPKEGDKVRVEGRRKGNDGTVEARLIRSGKQVLQLRDSRMKPLWTSPQS